MNYAAAHVDPQILQSLIPVRDLGEDTLVMLARKTPVERAPAGFCLINRGATDNSTYYLLEGRVELVAADGAKEVLEGGSEKARSPISQLRPRKYTVTTLSPIQFLRFDDTVLAKLFNQDANLASEVEAGIDKLADDPLYRDITRDLREDKLVFPSLPEVALRIRRTIEDEQATASTIAKVIQTDPAITAKLIKVANSPLYRGHARVTSCPAAVVRLGHVTTKQLVTSLTLHQLFRTRSSLLRKRMLELWQHSTQVAAICFVLARMTPGFDPEHALLAGLLHDMGTVPILSYAHKYREVASDPAYMDQVIAQLRGQIGSMILRKWEFSEDFVATALEAEDWYRDPAPDPDYCDLVMIAQLHSFVGTKMAYSTPRMDELPAFSKLALGKLSPKLSLQVLDEAKDQIMEARSFLIA